MAKHPEIDQPKLDAYNTSGGEVISATIACHPLEKGTIVISFLEDFSLRLFIHRLASMEVNRIDQIRFSSDRSDSSSVLMRTLQNGMPERMSVEECSGAEYHLVWAGDSEYWAECIEKCTSLLEAGRGHQNLMMRHCGDQDIVVSYNE